MRRLLLILLLGAAPPDEQARLIEAKRVATEASSRAEALTAAAGRERDAAARARAQEAALAQRVAAAAARVQAAEARVALVEQAAAVAQGRLAVAQAPAARLLGALTALARRPAIAAIAQPGSVDDLVHLRAVLGAQLPAVRARAADIRVELADARRLQTNAALAAAALRSGRIELEHERVALATLAARHRQQAAALGGRALAESDLAIAMGERARDLVDRLTEKDEAQAVAADLAALAGPEARPLSPNAVLPPVFRSGYRLPVTGRLTEGFGEVSTTGVRARGLSFRVASGAAVVAPAGGVVRYARPFRGYRTILIIDHADGWTSLLTGLGRADVRVGQTVATGERVGIAPAGDEAEVTVELRRRGRPADITALIG